MNVAYNLVESAHISSPVPKLEANPVHNCELEKSIPRLESLETNKMRGITLNVLQP